MNGRKLTFGDDPKVDETIVAMQLTSWRTYENYTGPLGLQTLTDIVGNHFGVKVEASENNGWGQWHRADDKGVGMDRSVATGTGYIGQYRPEVAKMFETLATCPDDLLLFLHHVPYTYKLHGGKTVIQYLTTHTTKAPMPSPDMSASGRPWPARWMNSATRRFWRNWNIKPGRPKCGAMPWIRGSRRPPGSPTRRAVWAMNPGVSRPKP